MIDDAEYLESQDGMCDDEEPLPEWCDANVSVTSTKRGDAEFLMLRLSSYYISVAQKKLEDFVVQHTAEFCHLNDRSSMYTLRQYEIYNQYTALFDELMEEFTAGCSQADIVEAIKSSNELAAMGKESTGTLVIDLLDAVSHFEGKLDGRLAAHYTTELTLYTVFHSISDFKAMMEEEHEQHKTVSEDKSSMGHKSHKDADDK
jgi:hypothetical protein